jgi:hypothetical protein
VSAPTVKDILADVTLRQVPEPQNFDEDYLALPMLSQHEGEAVLAFTFCDADATTEDATDPVVYPPRVIALYRLRDGAVLWMGADNPARQVPRTDAGALPSLAPLVPSEARGEEYEQYHRALSALIADRDEVLRILAGERHDTPLAQQLRHSFERAAESALLPYYQAIAPQFLAWMHAASA